MIDLIPNLSKPSESWYRAKHNDKHTRSVQVPTIEWLLMVIGPHKKGCLQLTYWGTLISFFSWWKINLHLPSSAFVGKGHTIWKHEDLLRRWSEPSSPARIWCFCWRRNSEMELVFGKSGLSCRLEWLMSSWTNDAVPCQGCSPEIICNGHWSKTLSNYWHVMLNPIRFSYPLLAIPEDSLIVKRLPAMQETQVQSLGREDPLEKETGAHSSTLD